MNLDDIDRISQLPVDIFLKQITYLPYKSVVAVCSANKKSQSYCSTEYSNQWKALIDNTFSKIDNYVETLTRIKNKLGLTEKEYNYKVYVELLIVLDPITRAMIAFQQRDMDSFDNFEMEVKFLALFLLDQRQNIENYLPYNEEGRAKYPYIYMIPIMDGTSTLHIIQLTMIYAEILRKFIDYGNVKGVKLIDSKNLNRSSHRIFYHRAIKNGHLNIVKYYRRKYKIPYNFGLRLAVENEQLHIVKYLVEKGKLTEKDILEALVFAKGEVEMYLLSRLNNK